MHRNQNELPQHPYQTAPLQPLVGCLPRCPPPRISRYHRKLMSDPRLGSMSAS